MRSEPVIWLASAAAAPSSTRKSDGEEGRAHARGGRDIRVD